jgi:hypothetical protein
MGREAPNEFREPRLSFIEGVSERLFMYGDASAMLVLVAGISTGPLLFGLEDMSLLPLVLTLLRSLDLTWWTGLPKSESSNAGMIAEL